jgi:hypothetical protein
MDSRNVSRIMSHTNDAVRTRNGLGQRLEDDQGDLGQKSSKPSEVATHFPVSYSIR